MKFANLLPLAFIVSLALVACGPAAQATPTTAPMDMTVPMPTGMTGAASDQMFIDMMVPHHQSAIAMAEVAQDRGEHAEIKDMAGQIIIDQQAEVEQLTAWRQDWYGVSQTPPMNQMPLLPDMMNMSNGQMTMDMTQMVESLRDAPEPFDQAFIDSMIGHHQMAVMAAQIALQQAEHPELQDMAEQIIEKQLAEIDELRQWRLAWYGSAEPAPTPTP